MCWCQEKISSAGSMASMSEENVGLQLMINPQILKLNHFLKNDVYKNRVCSKRYFNFLAQKTSPPVRYWYFSKSTNLILNNSKKVHFQRIKLKCSSPGIGIFVVTEECKESQRFCKNNSEKTPVVFLRK